MGNETFGPRGPVAQGADVVPVPFVSTAEASEHGVIFYELPQHLRPEQVDPLICNAVFAINASGWVWTAESCQGHPDAASYKDTGWMHEVRPFLRLVCRTEFVPAMVGLLWSATRDTDDEFAGQQGIEVYVPPNKAGSCWAQTLVYVKAHNVLTRNAGCRLFERFAEALHSEAAGPQTEPEAESVNEVDSRSLRSGLERDGE